MFLSFLPSPPRPISYFRIGALSEKEEIRGNSINERMKKLIIRVFLYNIIFPHLFFIILGSGGRVDRRNRIRRTTAVGGRTRVVKQNSITICVA